MEELGPSAPGKHLKLRYAGACRACQASLPAGAEALYYPGTGEISCEACAGPIGVGDLDVGESRPVPTGRPGASARREHARRTASREKATRDRHPRLGGFILAMGDEPQSTRAWEQGAVGEEKLGRVLDALAGPELQVLHDRRMPGTRGNIDHLAITSAGVFVIDAKRYTGRPQLRVEGGILRPRTEKLMVDRSDRTKLVTGVLKQVDVVRSALESAGLSMPVSGVLCFVDADWPVFGGSFATQGVHVTRPNKIAHLLKGDGALSGELRASAHDLLERRFPVA